VQIPLLEPMTCDKNHVEVEWDEKTLFCCPVCLGALIAQRQRKVIQRLTDALNASQENLEVLLKDNLAISNIHDGYKTANRIIFDLQNGI